MRAILIMLLAGTLFAGCSSTPISEQPAAGVEDRTPTQAKPPGPDSQSIGQQTIPKVDLTNTRPSKREINDPNSILSKRSVFFDYDKYDVKDEYKPLIEAHGQYLRRNPGEKTLIQGNTDERGSREYNLALGQRRADAMKRMLILIGAREEQVESVSLGEEKPRAQGTSEEAFAQNRRGDILYIGE